MRGHRGARYTLYLDVQWNILKYRSNYFSTAIDKITFNIMSGSSDITLSLESSGSTALPRLYRSSQHFPRAMSGSELRGQSVGPLYWHLPHPVPAWSKWQSCRPAEMQVRAAVTRPVQLMATWSGQWGRAAGWWGRPLPACHSVLHWMTEQPIRKGTDFTGH